MSATESTGGPGGSAVDAAAPPRPEFVTLRRDGALKEPSEALPLLDDIGRRLRLTAVGGELPVLLPNVVALVADISRLQTNAKMRHLL